MTLRRTTRLLAALLAAGLLLAPTGALAKEDDHRRNEAQKAMERARKDARRTPALAELQGTVVAVGAGTVDVKTGQANHAGLRNTTVKLTFAPKAYVTLNDKVVAPSAVKVGDSAKVLGLATGATQVNAYVARFSRTAPAPTTAKGTVSAVTATTFSFGTTTTTATATTYTLGTPSIVTLNGLPATLADVRVGDKGEVVAVGSVAYVARFTRPASPTAPAPVKLEGTVVTVSPLVVSVKGVPVTLTVANPALVTLNDATATLADARTGDRVVVQGISSPTGVTAYWLAFRR